MDAMQKNKRPFTQYDDNISPTQEDNGGNGASDRPIQDNGTKDANFSCGGMPTCTKVDYPLPKDPHAQYLTTPDAIDEFGLTAKEVGFNEGIHNYGLTSGEVGASDGNVEDQAFIGSATGSTPSKD